MPLPTTDIDRKKLPIFTGVLMYFPDAMAAVAEVSRIGNEQHNPGEPLHWAREKSTDQMNTALRHMIDHGTGTQRDTDGSWHLAKAIWRLAAELQLAIEKAAVPVPDTDYPIGDGSGGVGDCCAVDTLTQLKCERPVYHTGPHKAWDYHPRRDGEGDGAPRLYEGGEWA